MVKSMYQLMRQRILHIFLAREPVLAQEDSPFGREPTPQIGGAVVALDRVGGECACGHSEVFKHEDDHWTCPLVSTMLGGMVELTDSAP